MTTPCPCVQERERERAHHCHIGSHLPTLHVGVINNDRTLSPLHSLFSCYKRIVETLHTKVVIVRTCALHLVHPGLMDVVLVHLGLGFCFRGTFIDFGVGTSWAIFQSGD